MPAPNAAVVFDNDPMLAGQSAIDPTAFPTPQFTPNPNLGDRMRNRNWAGREQEVYREMRDAPLPHQYTRGATNPNFTPPSPIPATQYVRRPEAPTGLQTRGMSPSAIAAYTPPRPRGGWQSAPTNMQRYNRIVGRLANLPTMYAGTWPNQYYPGGSNTYIPSWEATGLLIKYTREVSYFRINKYAKELKVPKDQGYYLTLSAQDPYRVVSVNDYLWEDSVDAPGGRQERQAFGYLPYRTARYCFPFSLGRKSVSQAEWPILAEHARMAACKAMTVRTQLNTTVATTTSGWSGTGFTNTGATSAAWSTSPGGAGTCYIQQDINTAMIAVEQASGGIVTDEDGLYITMNPVEGRGLARSPEYRDYIKGSPDALSSLTDHRNPARKYSLAPQLYGLWVVIENAIRVTTPKSGNVPTPPADSQSYIWPTANVMISSKPQGFTAEGEQSLDFSTLAFRFFEQMTVESKSDPDNRRELGRVVEDYVVKLQAPQTGYLFTGAS